MARLATLPLRVWLAPPLVLLALACRDSISVDDALPIPPFAITRPSDETLQVPRALQLATHGGRDSGAVSWKSSDEAVVTVTETGVVTARFPGSVTITARRGVSAATLSLTATAGWVDVEPNFVTMDPNASQSFVAIVRDADGAVLSGVPVRWSTENASVASVNATTGVVTGMAAGTTWITAGGAGASGIATVQVNQPPGVPLVLSAIGSVGNHTCALEAPTGLAYCWGDNHAGALGMGDREGSDFPMPVNGARRFSILSVGDYATCGVELQTQFVYCWGSNSAGDLGDGTFVTRWEPTLVAGGLIRFSSVSASGGLTCGVEAQTGFGYCWGKAGLIGDGTSAQRSTPTMVGSGTIRFSIISASGDHACGLEAQTGMAYCWGQNEAGQLGDATTTNRLAPTPVAAEALRFSSISAGSVSCGIETETGFAYCWGPNAYGQIGDGTRTDRLVPTLVGGGGTRFRSISATGNTRVCGIEVPTDLVFCWGRYVGKVGEESTTDRLGPTLVGGGGTRFSNVVATYIGFCGTESQTGFGYCWNYAQPVATPIPRPISAVAPR